MSVPRPLVSSVDLSLEGLYRSSRGSLSRIDRLKSDPLYRTPDFKKLVDMYVDFGKFLVHFV